MAWSLDTVSIDGSRDCMDTCCAIVRNMLEGSGINVLGFSYSVLSNYKRSKASSFTDTTFSFVTQKLNTLTSLFLVPVIMSQGQLVGANGDGKIGGGNRKRLKISVPHFDNSDLIKSYSKTLIGRSMNPRKQDISSLLVMLPKIWKVEERVAGTDLGLGKFQFHFDNHIISTFG